MDSRKKEADRDRRLIFFAVLACLPYYFGAEALFEGSVEILLQAPPLFWLSCIAGELTGLNIAQPLIGWLARRKRGGRS